MKMILMLALEVSDKCDDERVKARIRTYVRVLKRFDSLSYDLDTAEKKLNQYGIDYFANLRSKNEDDTDNVNDNEEDDDSDKQLELPLAMMTMIQKTMTKRRRKTKQTMILVMIITMWIS